MAATYARVKAQVSSAFDRTDPVNLMATVGEIAEPRPASCQDMQLVVHAVVEKAMDGPVDTDDTVPGAVYSRTSETFADIIFHLRMQSPQFEVPDDKPMTFTRILLNVVQDEFEAMTPHKSEPDNEEIDDATMKRHINLCSLVGNLFVRKLLAAKVMAQVVHDLIGVRDRQPAKHFILCGSELLQVIGKSLDVSGQGNILMTQFLARLSNLAGSQKQDTREARYPQEVRNVVKAVHESRFQRWPSRPGSQILVSLLELADTEDVPTVRARLELLGQRGPRPEEEEPALTDDGGRPPQAFKVVVATTGRECAVIEGMDIGRLEEAPVKEEISRWTGVHPNRITVLMPDGRTILRDGEQ